MIIRNDTTKETATRSSLNAEGTSVASTPGWQTLVEHALWKSAPPLRKGGASVSTGDPFRVDTGTG